MRRAISINVWNSKKTAGRFELFVPLFFILYVFVGVCSFADYGVSWDEPTSRTNGLVSAKYIGELYAPFLLTEEVKSSPDLSVWRDKDYGVAFELPLVALELLFGLTEKRDIYLLRHMATFLFSVLGVFAVYKIAMLRFKDFRYGLLAALLIVTSPRLFAESFYNSKDVVFMAAFAIATYTMLRLLVKPSAWGALIHGMATAYATDVRVMGVMLVVGTVICVSLRVLKKEFRPRYSLFLIFIYLGSFGLCAVAMFPWLWSDPVGNFIQAFKNMAAFRWGGEILYLAENIRGANVPWHYVPVYIAVTTPVVYSLLFFAGFLSTASGLAKRKFSLWQNQDQMQDVIYLAVFISPVLAVVIFDSVLYDGWRQLYFIYPSFVLLATLGVKIIFNACSGVSVLSQALKLALVSTISLCVHWVYMAHPYQNVYFNSLVGGDWRKKFDVDYWGLSNTQALRSILSRDSSRSINVWADSFTSLDTAFLTLSSADAARLTLSRENNNPLYVLNNYRQSKDMSGDAYRAEFDVFDEIRVGDEVILTIYKFRSGRSTLNVD